MDTRIESLVKSLERNHHRFKDIFIDKDTGKEADKGEPLLYALRECFENLTVEMKE